MAKFVETCKLCLADDIVNGLQITSSEGKTLQIATIIYNHFPSIFLVRIKINCSMNCYGFN